MIKTAAAKPDARQASIHRSIQESGMLTDPTPKGFGLTVSSTMLEVRACTGPLYRVINNESRFDS